MPNAHKEPYCLHHTNKPKVVLGSLAPPALTPCYFSSPTALEFSGKLIQDSPFETRKLPSKESPKVPLNDPCCHVLKTHVLLHEIRSQFYSSSSGLTHAHTHRCMGRVPPLGAGGTTHPTLHLEPLFEPRGILHRFLVMLPCRPPAARFNRRMRYHLSCCHSNL